MTVIGEVRIFDGDGNLKRIITQDELVARNTRFMHGILDCDRVRLDVGYKAKKSSATINCQICQKEVVQKRAGKRYCSWQCAQVASGKRLGFNRTAKVFVEVPKPTISQCPQCKIEFTLLRSDQKYCGLKCRKQRENEGMKERKKKFFNTAQEIAYQSVNNAILTGEISIAFVPKELTHMKRRTPKTV